MADFKFHELYSLIGTKVDHPNTKDFFSSIHTDYKNFFVIHEPEKENIKNENDNWKCYDSQEMGKVIEVVGDIVASVSFSSGVTLYDETRKDHSYPYLLLNNLSLNTNREAIRKLLGPPTKDDEIFDQYQVDERITMGILYNMKNGLINTVSYGMSEIFSNPDKTPNRYSFIFMSLSL